MVQGINDSPTQVGVNLELKDLVHDIASSIKRVDERRPQAANARTGAIYQPGIGPHPETRAVNLVVAELAKLASARYSERLHVAVPDPVGRQKCDLCVGNAPAWNWAVEIKMLRLVDDNGNPNDNMLMHILSPYPNDRSALTDCLKLANSGLVGRKAVMIYGFDYPSHPWIRQSKHLSFWPAGGQADCSRGWLIEELGASVHREGRVFGWEIVPLVAGYFWDDRRLPCGRRKSRVTNFNYLAKKVRMFGPRSSFEFGFTCSSAFRNATRPFPSAYNKRPRSEADACTNRRGSGHISGVHVDVWYWRLLGTNDNSYWLSRSRKENRRQRPVRRRLPQSAVNR